MLFNALLGLYCGNNTDHVTVLSFKTRQAEDVQINPLITKLNLSNLKTQFVPRSKHYLPRLQKPIS